MRLWLLAWCAGFLDGEGSFCITKTGPQTKQPRMKPFVMCDQAETDEPLRRLQLVLGGAIHQRPRPTVTGKTVWHWSMSGSLQIREAVPRLLPYLCRKLRDAELLLEFCGHIPSRGCHASDVQRQEQTRVHALMKGLRYGG